MQKNKKQKKNNFWMVFRTLHFSTLTSLLGISCTSKHFPWNNFRLENFL